MSTSPISLSGSGLDVNSIIEQLMAIEKRPLLNLQKKEVGYQNSKVADLSSVATQKIKIQVGSNTATEISVTSSNNTLSGIRDAINDADAGVTAAVVKENSNFVISASNNTILFNDGTDKTATITAGTYTGSELATAVQTALNTAYGSSAFTVSYDSAATKFSITNGTGSSVNFLWGNSSTTTEQILGFDPVTDTVADSSSATSDDLVDGTYKLTITSDSTGASNSLKIQIDEDN